VIENSALAISFDRERGEPSINDPRVSLAERAVAEPADRSEFREGTRQHADTERKVIVLSSRDAADRGASRR
jgi:hypothetical protein